MKKLFLLFILILSCQDKVIETKVKDVSTPALCPSVDSELSPSPYSFAGIANIENITQTSVHIKWERNSNFHSYHIISITSHEHNVIKLVEADKSEVTLNALSPDSEYHFLLRAMDKHGQLETNSNIISVRTKPWPNFSNQKSLSFNGSQSVELGESRRMLPEKSYTIAFWIKPDAEKNENAHIITFHRDNYRAASALALLLHNGTLKLKIQNKNYKSSQRLSENEWKFITLTSNGISNFLYVDGERVLKVDQETPERGLFKASLASFTGIRKGYRGKLDELAIFQTYMSRYQVQELYNQGRAINYPMHSVALKLKYWYQFGDHKEDGVDKIIEHVSGIIHGNPLNLDESSFTNDSP